MAVSAIAKIYARRIERGEISFDQIPLSIKEQVKEELMKQGWDLFNEED